MDLENERRGVNLSHMYTGWFTVDGRLDIYEERDIGSKIGSVK